MSWLHHLFTDTESAAQSVVILALIAMVGLAVGSIKFRGLGLGIAGVLFAGLAAGHFGLKINPSTLEFAREFGLILFVYTIGVQVGPGFFNSLKRQGLPLNLLAAGIVLGGALTAVVLWKLFMRPDQLAAAVGLLAGATTNTPSLASAQQALRDQPGVTSELLALPGQAYAIAYPFGILGIILTMLLIRWAFRIDLQREIKDLEAAARASAPPLENANIEVHNHNLADIPLRELPLIGKTSVVISRVYRNGKSELARPDTKLQVGDVIHAVGVASAVRDLKLLVGKDSPIDVRAVPGPITAQRLLVSKSAVVGRPLGTLAYPNRFGVNITRITRSGIDLPVNDNMRLQAGDFVTVVGEKDAIAKVADELGNSSRQLQHPHLVGVFLGVALGIVIGSIPIAVPGLPAPLRLGLAAGPLVVAIVLSHIGRIGPVLWYMPHSANLMLRELGIVLFMACVGLKGGGAFVANLQASGVQWLVIGAAITLLPLLVFGFLARAILKLNYLTLCGLLSGALTDPPALAFAQSVTGSDGPTVSYATVYPLVMLLRVFSTQAIVLLLFTL
ncbi:MAG: putative transporter [Tepidisphaerales bacterium]